MNFRRTVPFGLACLLLSSGVARAASQTPVAALIARQSQAFSDASATGDVAAFRTYLDDRVIFIDESGNVSTKSDFLQPGPPPSARPKQTLTQTHRRVEVHGNVAVTSFDDVSVTDFHGQTLRATFRSTETWLHEAGGWKMISSQTLALQNDPPAVRLPANVLDDYAGTYTAGPGYSVRIARAGDGLTASVNGGPPVALEAELKDVFFLPGSPRLRRIFQRDEAGTITGFVSRREGRDIVFKRTVS